MPAKTSYRKGIRRKRPMHYLCSEQKVNKILRVDNVFAGMARSYNFPVVSGKAVRAPLRNIWTVR